MAKAKYIFIFIFLAGMLYTVFQYVPILEEETPGHKVELAKKAKQGDLADGDGDSADEDFDDDDDSEKDLNYYCSSSYTTFHTINKLRYFRGNSLYKHLLEQTDTPPPKF